jgi:AcrR family transcriptional regulator
MSLVAVRPPGRPAASTREVALATATERFLAGERVDMRAIAGELGLARATMHHWFGTRDLLLGELLGTLAEERLLAIRRRAGGHGGSALLDTADRFNRQVADNYGLNVLLAREHKRALRILTSNEGLVQPRVVATIEHLIATEVEAGHCVSPLPPDILAYVLVRVGEASLYNDAFAGNPQSLDRQRDVLATLLGMRES